MRSAWSSAGKHSRKKKGIIAKLLDLKYRRYLAVGALALVLFMGINGTLMLLTAVTPSATNVMTAGKAEIALFETVQVPGQSDPATYEITANREFELGTIVPGQVVTKAPFVKNTGDVPVCIFVEFTFSTKDEADDDTEGTTEDLWEDFQGGIAKNSNWVYAGGSFVSTGDGGDGKAHFGYFYVLGDQLARVETALPADPPDPVFNIITIPKDWTNDDISDVKFFLDVKAYAIQADYVLAFDSDDIDDWKNTFSEQFIGSGLAWLAS